jgi:hypothetical protein
MLSYVTLEDHGEEIRTNPLMPPVIKPGGVGTIKYLHVSKDNEKVNLDPKISCLPLVEHSLWFPETLASAAFPAVTVMTRGYS